MSVAARAHRIKKPAPVKLTVAARCDQSAQVTLTATLRVTPSRRHPSQGHVRRQTFRLGPVRAAVRAGAGKALVLRLPARAVTALLHHAGESVAFTLSARNANGVSRATAKLARLSVRKR